MAVDKKNIFLFNTVETLSYAAKGGGGSDKNYPDRDIALHAKKIQKKLQDCFAQSLEEQKTDIRHKEGIYLEFSGSPKYDLAVKSLENLNQGVRLLNVHKESEINEKTNAEATVTATVYVPDGKENYFIKKIDEYSKEKTKNGNPKNNELISSIEDVKLATIESFWMEEESNIPRERATWCEIWLRYDCKSNKADSLKNTEDNITSICQENNIPIKDNCIVFPERIVKLIYANANDLNNLIDECPFITELRCAPEVNNFFEELSNSEQKEWVEELLSRTTYNKNNITVCLLDTGITSNHPLLAPAINENNIHCIKPSWIKGDCQGHGTGMAGIALFGDLKQALESQKQINITHEIESVKILSPNCANEPELYGDITKQAVSLAEINNSASKRVICMAITALDDNTSDGSPTSWSASIDSITSGADEENEKRLFLISSGNVVPNEFLESPYPRANTLHSVENPGQSWNAITVGAYTNEIEIKDSSFSNFNPLASLGELSPYSSTSATWNSIWPIKPDVLFDGGNMAFNGKDYTECPDLSLLTTHFRPLEKQFSTIWATSSATAQAAWFCSQILNEYPNIWPETVRALMIHSADWTPEMKRQFCSTDTKKKGRKQLLRHCGYGIPNLEKVIQCMNNNVNMIIQGELQPYEQKKMKEMHMHKLPWPKEVLQSLGETLVTLKVTLSYFVEPGPGEVGWKDKYRYQSCGLRFDVINSNETIDDFKKRINVKMRGEDKKDKGEGTSGRDRWY